MGVERAFVYGDDDGGQTGGVDLDKHASGACCWRLCLVYVIGTTLREV
jgi:hypothetical protein